MSPKTSTSNWFQRHLNWTVILAIAATYPFSFIAGFILGFILASVDPYISEETVEGVSYLVGLLLCVAIVFPVAAWALDHKGRSLWHMLWLLIPFGLIVFLCLENRRPQLDVESGVVKEVASRPASRISGKWVIGGVVSISGIVLIAGLVVATLAAGSEPSYDTPIGEIETNPAYWNTDWRGSELELQVTVQTVNELYFQTHTFIEGETDCNDMAVDIWNMLLTKGIQSVIVIGNLDLTGEFFTDCDHAWLLIFDSEGASLALEPTSGILYFSEDVAADPTLRQYWEGFFYTKPSDLRADIRERW